MGKRILRIREACNRLGIGRSTLYEWIGRGDIKTVKIGPRSVGLIEDEIDALIEAKIAERDAA